MKVKKLPEETVPELKKSLRRKHKRMSLLVRNLIRTNTQALKNIDLSAIVLF